MRNFLKKQQGKENRKNEERMNRKKYKEVKAKINREDSLDYISSDSDSETDFPLEEKHQKDEWLPPVYCPLAKFGKPVKLPRDENPVVYIDIHAAGGRKLLNGDITRQRTIGRLHFELRQDLVPVTCRNFLFLILGSRGFNPDDGITYHYKGSRIHRILRGQFFQSGDLLDQKGLCSRSVMNNGGLFKDENFVLRHAGPGCISMCNRGADTNGSLFQVCFSNNPDLDNVHVVFGCLAHKDDFKILEKISSYSSESGLPTEHLYIGDCGLAYPDPQTHFKKLEKLAEKNKKRN